jgi:hypothetical protein
LVSLPDAGAGVAGVAAAAAGAATFFGLVTMTTKKSFSWMAQDAIVSSSLSTFPEWISFRVAAGSSGLAVSYNINTNNKATENMRSCEGLKQAQAQSKHFASEARIHCQSPFTLQLQDDAIQNTRATTTQTINLSVNHVQ